MRPPWLHADEAGTQPGFNFTAILKPIGRRHVRHSTNTGCRALTHALAVKKAASPAF
jgi:hypothetical protein